MIEWGNKGEIISFENNKSQEQKFRELNTWRTKINIDNIPENYYASINVPKATINSDVKLMNWLKQRKYQDNISFNKKDLDLKAIRQSIRENQYEYDG